MFTAQRVYPSSKTNVLLGIELKKYNFNSQMKDLHNKVLNSDDCPNIYVDYCNKNNNLWLFSSAKESKINAEIPMLIGNIRPVSQHALLAFLKMTEYKIEAIGLLSWNNDKVICDPVAWRLFY